MNSKPWTRKAMGGLFCAGTVILVGCNSQPPPATPANSATSAAPAAASTAPAASVYAPPSADQLYQMVAPIALFPDKLVAQVLAGSTYPEQITAADGVVAQNPNLQGASLQTAIAQQPWDASVKGLTAFPSVLDQMAKNIDWTTALGDAYVNDPTDVMNAIQVMRQRASKHGNLRSSPQQRVTTLPEQAPTTRYANNGDNGYPVYSGSPVVPPPDDIYQIASSQPDTVYVPRYDSQSVYGDEVPPYPGYTYQRPREYSGGQVAAVSAVTFGAGVLVGALFEHQHDRSRDRPDYGYQSWGMNWGGRGPGGGEGNNNGGWQRPAVVHNDTTYVSRSTTVVNRYVTNNINNSRNVTQNNNTINSNNQRIASRSPANAPRGAMNGAVARAAIAHAPASPKPSSMPNFGVGNAHPHSPQVATAPLHASPGGVPKPTTGKPNFGVGSAHPHSPQVATAPLHASPGGVPKPTTGRPNFGVGSAHPQNPHAVAASARALHAAQKPTSAPTFNANHAAPRPHAIATPLATTPQKAKAPPANLPVHHEAPAPAAEPHAAMKARSVPHAANPTARDMARSHAATQHAQPAPRTPSTHPAAQPQTGTGQRVGGHPAAQPPASKNVDAHKKGVHKKDQKKDDAGH